jgi:hypothetical protein
MNMENVFAILAAVVVLVGVFFAAEDALAGSGIAPHQEQVRLPARVANKDETARQADMAEDAARSVKEAVRLDLDIQLGNHTSTVMVRD